MTDPTPESEANTPSVPDSAEVEKLVRECLHDPWGNGVANDIVMRLIERVAAFGRAEYERGVRDSMVGKTLYYVGYQEGFQSGIEKAAEVAEINDGRTPGSEAEIEALNIATHIRKLLPPSEVAAK